jgi:hypothetical protein
MLQKLIDLLVGNYIYITSTYKTDTPFSAEGKCVEVIDNSNGHFIIRMKDGKDFGISPNVFRKKWVEQKNFRKISLLKTIPPEKI